MSRQEIDWSRPQRLPAAALIIILYKVFLGILKIAWPLLLLLLLRKKGGGMDSIAIAALIATFISLVNSLIEYFYFRFFIVNHELIIKQGFFVKKTIKLPLGKIQAVHTEEGWLHNILGVSRIVFDSAGSEKSEAKIEALDRHRSLAIREFLLGQGAALQLSETETAAPAEKLITLGGKDLLKLSISANHLKAFFLLLTFSYSTLENIGLSDKEYGRLWQWLSNTVQADTFRLFLFLAALVMIIAILISFVRILLAYADFEIRKAPKGFHIGGGLISRKEKFIPFRKIQFISWEANWLRKKLGLFMLQFQIAGDDLMDNKMQVKIPLTKAEFIPLLIGNYKTLLSVQEMQGHKISKIYVRRRLLLIGIAPGLLLLPLFYYYFNERSFFVLLWIFFVWLSAWLFQRRFRFWMDDTALQIRKGVFGLHESILKWNNIQSIELKQSIYQRNHNLATLNFSTAAGMISIPYIQLSLSENLMNYALYKIETSKEPWM